MLEDRLVHTALPKSSFTTSRSAWHQDRGVRVFGPYTHVRQTRFLQELLELIDHVVVPIAMISWTFLPCRLLR